MTDSTMTDCQHEYRMLTLRLRALNIRLKSRKRADIVRRATVRAEMDAVRAQRDALDFKQGTAS